MLIKEVFLYQMKHILTILISTMMFLSLNFGSACGESLAQALTSDDEQQSGAEDTIAANADVSIDMEEMERVLSDISTRLQEIEERNELAREIGYEIESVSYSIPSPSAGRCATWVSRVYKTAGYGRVDGNADDMYYKWCDSSDMASLSPGMVIAVPYHSNTSAGRIYGHVGIIVQHDDGAFWVRHSTGTIEEDPIDEWIAFYGDMCQPAWGYANDIV